MFPIQQNALADIPVQNQNLPRGGPKCVPVPLVFSAQTGFLLDLENFQAMGRFSNLQTLFIDNADNAQVLTVAVSRGGQEIKAPAGSQGYYPILSSNPSKLEFSVPAIGAADSASIFLLNIPMPSSVWIANPTNAASTTVNATVRQTGTGDVSLPFILANHPVVLAGVQASDFAAVITPTALSKYFLNSFSLQLTPDAVLSNGATFAVVTLTDSVSGIIFETVLQIGSAPSLSPASFAWLSAVNSTLSVTILASVGGAAITLTGGKLLCNFGTSFGLFV